MSILYAILSADENNKGQSVLLPLSGSITDSYNESSLFMRMFLNITEFVDDKNIISVTGVKNTALLKSRLSELQAKFFRKSSYNIISLPEEKKSASALASAVKFISDNLKFTQKDSIIISFPANLFISDRTEFSKSVLKGINLAKKGYIVSFVSERNNSRKNADLVYATFNPEISEIEPGSYEICGFSRNNNISADQNPKDLLFINSGIYMFKPETFFSLLKENAPKIYEFILKTKIKSTVPSVYPDEYKTLPDISAEDIIFSGKENVAALVADCGNDSDFLKSIEDILPKDKDGNYLSDNVINVNSKNTSAYSSSKSLIVAGLNNKVVIADNGAVIVASAENPELSQKIYDTEENKNIDKNTPGTVVNRPWGSFSVLERGDDFLTKCITVNPGQKLSLQFHNHRTEHWIVSEGTAVVTKGNETFTLNPGQSIDIDKKEIHSLQNLSHTCLKVIEIWQGDKLDENDIERIEDIYGRV